MTRKALLSTLFLATLLGAGCGTFDTPWSLRGTPKPDRPGLSIEEQQRNGRARYGLPDDDYRVGPKTFDDRPSPSGR
ncbi:hypothetical protein [Fimbriiglobus ruber]|uniref:Lipoprotein n=1 Tax=Fimbriiglobus ruber TaxID=1908690 RepID=A0A225DHS1_9BACT|nr:hypothetical protein [Fimbriiglobus ruber]OWK40533.1 hypothetical protein FRUB_05452 [Fimbriiglobus ruber]